GRASGHREVIGPRPLDISVHFADTVRRRARHLDVDEPYAPWRCGRCHDSERLTRVDTRRRRKGGDLRPVLRHLALEQVSALAAREQHSCGQYACRTCSQAATCAAASDHYSLTMCGVT